MLQDAGIKLTSVASQTYSQSARAVLEALLVGVTDPDQLAELAKSRMRPKIPRLREALASRFQIEHHGVMVAQLLAHIDTLDAAIQSLDERIESVLAPHAQLVELLCTIPGVQTHAAQVLIAECGLDMTQFPTVGHFASWAGACPGHHESAGRRRSGQTRRGPRWLTECAKAPGESADGVVNRPGGCSCRSMWSPGAGRRVGQSSSAILIAFGVFRWSGFEASTWGREWQRPA